MLKRLLNGSYYVFDYLPIENQSLKFLSQDYFECLHMIQKENGIYELCDFLKEELNTSKLIETSIRISSFMHGNPKRIQSFTSILLKGIIEISKDREESMIVLSVDDSKSVDSSIVQCVQRLIKMSDSGILERDYDFNKEIIDFKGLNDVENFLFIFINDIDFYEWNPYRKDLNFELNQVEVFKFSFASSLIFDNENLKLVRFED